MAYFDMSLRIYPESMENLANNEEAFSVYCKPGLSSPVTVIATNEDMAAKGYLKAFNTSIGKRIDVIRKNGTGFSYLVGISVAAGSYDPCLIKGELEIEGDDDEDGVGDDDMDGIGG